MKLIITLFGLSCLNFFHAQSTTKNALYLTSEFSFGAYNGYDLQLNYVSNEKYSFKFGFSSYFRTAKTLPADFSSGLNDILLLGFDHPYDKISTYQIGFGMLFNLDKDGPIRANISLGLGYSIIREPSNWVKISDAYLVENYTWNYSEYTSLSLVFNPKIEFPIYKSFGLTITPSLLVAKNRSNVGIGAGLMLGLL